MTGEGTSKETDGWLADLRARMVDLARRRVQPEDVEDVVHNAMQVVVERGLRLSDSEVEGLPPVAWCLQVLRNTIGNHYKRQRTQRKWMDSTVELERVPVSLEAMSSEEKLRAIEAALDEMMRDDPQCGSYLQRTLDGHSANAIATEEGVEVAAFYKRLYRCRCKLRQQLRRRGVLPE